MNIREEIVEKRRKRILAEGPTLGHRVPPRRIAAQVSFGVAPMVICEVKRRSPSRGEIAMGLDPVDQAQSYWDSGIRSVSVLTEEDYFAGSLSDLMAIKAALPGLAVLRKDFLISLEDVEVSHRVGADAILLIASVLDAQLLGEMLDRAEQLGMQALVEVHNREDVEKVRPFRPRLMGINSRNLETFQMDLFAPLALLPAIDWPTRVVFESGIFQPYQARWAGQAGFSGVLVGEAAVRDPHLAGLLGPALSEGSQAGQSGTEGFWSVLGRRLFSLQSASRETQLGYQQGDHLYSGPLVKVCGITNREDAEFAISLGADVLGFVFAPSPRQISPGVMEEFADLPVLKAGVVFGGTPEFELAVQAAESGGIDVLQLHGDETPQDCWALNVPWYKALRLKDEKVIDQAGTYLSPRVLFDAYHPRLSGGSGSMIEDDLQRLVKREPGPWLAGGLNHLNIRSFLASNQPELVDVSSGLESEPGRKDRVKMEQFFKEIMNVRE